MAQGAGPSAPRARVVHHVPGRLRLRVMDPCDDPQMLQRVQRYLLGLPGVESVRVNAAACSVVVHYAAADRGFASRLSQPDALRRLAHQAAGDVLAERSPSRAARVAPHLGQLLPLASAVGHLVARRRGAPMWMRLALFVFDALVTLHGVRTVTREPGAHAAQIRTAVRRIR